MKFRKKPVTIEAIQWNGFNESEIMYFIGGCTQPIEGESLIIPTLEGDMTAHINDWIIKGVKGEFYPCKPDIFEMTYESESPIQPKRSAEEIEQLVQDIGNSYCINGWQGSQTERMFIRYGAKKAFERAPQFQQSAGWSDRDMLKAFWAGYYEHADYSSKGTTNSDFEYWLSEYKSQNKVK